MPETNQSIREQELEIKLLMAHQLIDALRYDKNQLVQDIAALNRQLQLCVALSEGLAKPSEGGVKE